MSEFPILFGYHGNWIASLLHVNADVNIDCFSVHLEYLVSLYDIRAFVGHHNRTNKTKLLCPKSTLACMINSLRLRAVVSLRICDLKIEHIMSNAFCLTYTFYLYT